MWGDLGVMVGMNWKGGLRGRVGLATRVSWRRAM